MCMTGGGGTRRPAPVTSAAGSPGSHGVSRTHGPRPGAGSSTVRCLVTGDFTGILPPRRSCAHATLMNAPAPRPRRSNERAGSAPICTPIMRLFSAACRPIVNHLGVARARTRPSPCRPTPLLQPLGSRRSARLDGGGFRHMAAGRAARPNYPPRSDRTPLRPDRALQRSRGRPKRRLPTAPAGGAAIPEIAGAAAVFLSTRPGSASGGSARLVLG